MRYLAIVFLFSCDGAYISRQAKDCADMCAPSGVYEFVPVTQSGGCTPDKPVCKCNDPEWSGRRGSRE